MTTIIDKSFTGIYRTGYLRSRGTRIVNLVNQGVSIIKQVCANIIHMHNITFTHIPLSASTFSRGNSDCFCQPVSSCSYISFIIYAAGNLSFQFCYCLSRKTTDKDIIVVIISCQKCIRRITSTTGISKSWNLRCITDKLHKH